MTNEEYIFTSSEIQQLESLLADMPKESVINRWGLEKRLQSARALIANILPEALAKKARLTFRGRPVDSSRGIAAEFGTKAAQFFTDAFAAVAAALSENLHCMGPIPDKEKNQLLITGTAVGSYGFEFELPSSAAVPLKEAEMFEDLAEPATLNTPEEAMEKLEALFQAAAQGTDDELAELIDEIHPRAVKKAAEFLEYVAEQEAWCGLQFEERMFRFAGAEQVRASAARLTPDNIKESEATFTGEFRGFLPTSRTFEFKVSDEGGVLCGKIATTIEDPDELNRNHLHKLVTVRLGTITVGQGRPRYTLHTLDDISS